MFAVILVPEFSLQALLRGQSQAQPTVVVDDEVVLKRQRGKSGKSPVIAMNAQAAVAGVVAGMTAPQAQARCQGVRVLTRDRVEESAVYAELLEKLGEYCADVEATGPGVVTADLFGCGQWHEDWGAYGEEVCQSLGRALRLDLVMGMARTPDQARVAAMSLVDTGPVVRVLGEDVEETLGEHPIELLRPPNAVREVLGLWGITTVGQFLSLPRDDVGQRLGAEAVTMWDLVSGKRTRLLRLCRAPDSYEQRMSFDYELETLEPLLFVLRRGLDSLTTRLAAQYRVASQIKVTLSFANRSQVVESFRVPDPSIDVDLLFRLLQRRLETLVAKAPVVGLGLALTPQKPKKRQLDFFRAALQDPNRFAHTLAELEALLSSDRVGRPRPLGTHRPDAFALEPFDRSIESADRPATPGGGEGDPTLGSVSAVPLGLPLRRCRPPMLLQVATERRSGDLTPTRVLDGPIPGAVSASRGPWRASGDWWDPGAWMREEWDVELGDGVLCRLARMDEEWYLEGLYG